jgi:hypothetical protein
MPDNERKPGIPKASDVRSAASEAFTHTDDTASDAGTRHQISSAPIARPGTKQYMVVEHLRYAAEVYRRLWDRGRMAPEGLVFVSAWVDEDIQRSYRLMQTHDRRLLDEWMANWNDLIDFEVHPVITPEEAGERLWAQLQR